MYKKCKEFKDKVELSKEKLVRYKSVAAMSSGDADMIDDILSGMDAAISIATELMHILQAVGADQEAVLIQEANREAEALLEGNEEYKALVERLINYDNNFVVVEAFVVGLDKGEKLKLEKLGVDMGTANHYMTPEERGYVDYLQRGSYEYLYGEYLIYKNYLEDEDEDGDDEDDTTALLLTEVRQDEYFDPSNSSFVCKDGSKDMLIVSWVEDVDFKPEVQDSNVFDLTLGVALLVLLESHLTSNIYDLVV